MTQVQDFLADFEVRPIALQVPVGWQVAGLVLGAGAMPLEVVLLNARNRPSVSELRNVWKARLAGRATGLLVVVLHDGRAALCGPQGDQPPAFVDLEARRVEQLCRAALSEPDRHRALRFLLGAIPELEARTPGVRNEGLFATHELIDGVRARADWEKARPAASTAQPRRGEELLRALGFTIEAMPGPTSILRAGEKRAAVAVLLDRGESLELSSQRFSGLSPVSYALAKADAEGVRFVIALAGPVIRLYPVETGVGTGRRGRTETFVEVHLDLLTPDQVSYLWLLFSADSLLPGGAVDQILQSSQDYAADLGVRLRERIYDDVVPPLAAALLQARRLFGEKSRRPRCPSGSSRRSYPALPGRTSSLPKLGRKLSDSAKKKRRFSRTLERTRRRIPAKSTARNSARDWSSMATESRHSREARGLDLPEARLEGISFAPQLAVACSCGSSIGSPPKEPERSRLPRWTACAESGVVTILNEVSLRTSRLALTKRGASPSITFTPNG
jgi:hypothetical protein